MKKCELRKYNGFIIIFLIIFFHLFLYAKSVHCAEEALIKVGIPRDSRFYGTDENGFPYGYGYEYLEAISKTAGFKYNYVYADSLNDSISMLLKGEVDMLNVVIPTPARAEILDYSKYPTGIIFGEIFVSKSNMKIDYGDLKSMNSMKVGLLFGSAHNELFFEYATKNNFSNSSIIYLDDNSFSAALQNGDVEAIVADNLRGSKDEKPVARFSPMLFYIATKKENQKLMNSINSAISQILIANPNFNSDLRRKYYPNDRATLIFTEEERNFIKNSKVITVAYDTFWAPFESYDTTKGVAVGTNADILKLISGKTGLKFEFLNGHSYEECIDMVSKGKADMILSYDTNYKMEDLLKIYLSDTYLSSPVAILGYKKRIEQNSIFAVPRTYPVVEQYIRDMFPDNKIIIYDSIESCYKALKRGEANFTMENAYVANEVIRSGRYEGLSIVTIATLKDNLSFALRHDINENLLKILNKTIHSISQAEFERILLEHTMQNLKNLTFSAFYSQHKGLILSLAIVFFAVISLTLGVMVFFQIKGKRSIWEIAYIDTLTGLGNFNKFKIDAGHLIRKNHDTTYMIEKLDIDRFKFINEMYGFQEGDLVLKDLAKSIEFILDEKMDTFARIGSDEFIMLRSYASPEQVEKDRILFENKFIEIHGIDKSPLIKFPTGRYVIEHGEFDINKIFEKVNYAHRLAKQQKGFMICHYNDNVKNSAIYLREIEGKMENALKENKFLVYLQPKFSLSDESIVGAEALVRWEDDGKDLIYPSRFIPLFEQNGFILKLDMYMVEKVCETLNSWIDDGIEPITISVNFSRLHLLNHISFLRELCEAVDKNGVPRKYIEIEFTESIMLDNEEVFEDIYIRLRNAGFTISMDDFGTGYSSLGMLKNIPIDVIKMDKSFFDSSNDSERSEIVISYVMLMAKSLNIKTVAEGVETKEQIDVLKKVGCDIVQGYYYSKPLSVADFTERFRNV